MIMPVQLTPEMTKEIADWLDFGMKCFYHIKLSISTIVASIYVLSNFVL
jgi:hypothetical protein